MENSKSNGITVLKLLFATFVVLKLLGKEPFAGWSWFGFIALPIYVQLFFDLCYRVWERMGLRQMFYVMLEMKRYEIMLAREKKKYGKIMSNETNARLEKLKREIEATNKRVRAENDAMSDKS